MAARRRSGHSAPYCLLRYFVAFRLPPGVVLHIDGELWQSVRPRPPTFRRWLYSGSRNMRRGRNVPLRRRGNCCARAPGRHNSPSMVLHTDFLGFYRLPDALLTIYAVLAVFCPPATQLSPATILGHSFPSWLLDTLGGDGPPPIRSLLFCIFGTNLAFRRTLTVRCPLGFLASYGHSMTYRSLLAALVREPGGSFASLSAFLTAWRTTGSRMPSWPLGHELCDARSVGGDRGPSCQFFPCNVHNRNAEIQNG